MRKRISSPTYTIFQASSVLSEGSVFVPLTRKGKFYSAGDIRDYTPFRSSKSLPIKDSPLMYIEEPLVVSRSQILILLWIDEVCGSSRDPLSPLSDTTNFSPFRSADFSEQLRQESSEKDNIEKR